MSPWKWQWTSRRVILIKNQFRAYSFQLNFIANRQPIRLQDRGTGNLRLYEFIDPIPPLNDAVCETESNAENAEFRINLTKKKEQGVSLEIWYISPV